MCLLTVTKPGYTPDYTRLYYASRMNPDGFGFAVRTDDQMLVVRSMDFDWIIGKYEEAVKDYPDAPSMFHLRMATHGTTDISNCHPFTDDSTRTVMAHNGILPLPMAKHDRRSDTRAFAEDYLPDMLPMLFRSRKARRRLRKYMGNGNKIALLSMDERMETPYIILNEHLGHWREGTWYSNDSYEFRPRYWSYTSAYKSRTYDWDDEEDNTAGKDSSDSKRTNDTYFDWCRSCGDTLSEEDVFFWGYCQTCNSCSMCAEKKDLCLCFHGESKSMPVDHAYEVID